MKKIKMKKAFKKYEVFDVSNCDGAPTVHLWTELQMVREVNRDRSYDWSKYNLKDWLDGWFHFVENPDDGLTCPQAIKEHKVWYKTLKQKGKIK
jgi:hypothetical protein